jgi:hypothetical protein
VIEKVTTAAMEAKIILLLEKNPMIEVFDIITGRVK